MIVCREVNSNIDTIGGVVEKGTRESEISGSNPTDLCSTRFYAKKCAIKTGG